MSSDKWLNGTCDAFTLFGVLNTVALLSISVSRLEIVKKKNAFRHELLGRSKIALVTNLFTQLSLHGRAKTGFRTI